MEEPFNPEAPVRYNVTVRDRLDQETRTATRLFLERVALRFPVLEAWVFGSRAKGTHRPDSDADVAIVLSGFETPFLKTKLAMADVAFDVMLETGVRIEPLPVWEEQWKDPEHFPNARLLRTIAREGLRL